MHYLLTSDLHFFSAAFATTLTCCRSLVPHQCRGHDLIADDKAGEISDLQRKIQPHGTLATTRAAAWQEAYASSLPQEAAEEAMCARTSSRRQSIVIVASLLEKVPNLGGLTRTCEIFQAESLVLADLAVVKDPEFTGVSVTAEHHVPMKVRILGAISSGEQFNVEL
jgi:tRNA G18 (ribose-2'-O)-methylase SpoU